MGFNSTFGGAASVWMGAQAAEQDCRRRRQYVSDTKNYNNLVDEYNELNDKFRASKAKLRAQIDKYNVLVNEYNEQLDRLNENRAEKESLETKIKSIYVQNQELIAKLQGELNEKNFLKEKVSKLKLQAEANLDRMNQYLQRSVKAESQVMRFEKLLAIKILDRINSDATNVFANKVISTETKLAEQFGSKLSSEDVDNSVVNQEIKSEIKRLDFADKSKFITTYSEALHWLKLNNSTLYEQISLPMFRF